jgi:hypothetical protein
MGAIADSPSNGLAFHLRGYDRAPARERPDRETRPNDNLRICHRWRPRQVQTLVRRRELVIHSHTTRASRYSNYSIT